MHELLLSSVCCIERIIIQSCIIIQKFYCGGGGGGGGGGANLGYRKKGGQRESGSIDNCMAIGHSEVEGGCAPSRVEHERNF